MSPRRWAATAASKLRTTAACLAFILFGTLLEFADDNLAELPGDEDAT